MAECRVFQNPGRVVQGKAVVDQVWIDDTIESGVSACSWPRPPKVKAPKAKPKAKAVAPLPKAAPVVTPPAPAPAPVPAPVVVAPPPAPVPAAPVPWHQKAWSAAKKYFWSVPW